MAASSRRRSRVMDADQSKCLGCSEQDRLMGVWFFIGPGFTDMGLLLAVLAGIMRAFMTSSSAVERLQLPVA